MSGEYDDGYDIGVRVVSRVLTDLIAELRDGCTRQEEAVGPLITTHRVREHLDHYEARLREVTGDE